MNRVKNLTPGSINREKLYRTSELMDIIPFTQGVIRSMLKKKLIPARKVSSVKGSSRGTWMVKGSDLEMFLMGLGEK